MLETLIAGVSSYKYIFQATKLIDFNPFQSFSGIAKCSIHSNYFATDPDLWIKFEFGHTQLTSEKTTVQRCYSANLNLLTSRKMDCKSAGVEPHESLKIAK